MKPVPRIFTRGLLAGILVAAPLEANFGVFSRPLRYLGSKAGICEPNQAAAAGYQGRQPMTNRGIFRIRNPVDTAEYVWTNPANGYQELRAVCDYYQNADNQAEPTHSNVIVRFSRQARSFFSARTPPVQDAALAGSVFTLNFDRGEVIRDNYRAEGFDQPAHVIVDGHQAQVIIRVDDPDFVGFVDKDRYTAGPASPPRAEAPAVPGSGGSGRSDEKGPVYPVQPLLIVSKEGQRFRRTSKNYGGAERVILTINCEEDDFTYTPRGSGLSAKLPEHQIDIICNDVDAADSVQTRLSAPNTYFRLAVIESHRADRRRTDFRDRHVNPFSIWRNEADARIIEVDNPDDLQTTTRNVSK